MCTAARFFLGLSMGRSRMRGNWYVRWRIPTHRFGSRDQCITGFLQGGSLSSLTSVGSLFFRGRAANTVAELSDHRERHFAILGILARIVFLLSGSQSRLPSPGRRSCRLWKFDRFARSTSHLLRALETFGALGIEFCSLSEQLDTSTPAGKMVFTVLGAVAELERSLIAERVRAGLRNARAKGKRLGRPPVQASDSEIRKLLDKGVPMQAIGKQLGVSASTVCRRARATTF
jgi:resolvase-like protein